MRTCRKFPSLTSSRLLYAFWYNSKCQDELSDLLHQIGTPTIFFTLSVANMHWPDLHALMPRIEPYNPQEAQK